MKVLLHGFWLGVLSPKHLHNIDFEYYTNEEYYTLDRWNTRGLFRWEEDLVRRYFIDCSKIMLLGAGGGREIYGLREFGFEIRAFECHQLLREFANGLVAREKLNATVSSMERDIIPDVAESFSGAIWGWGVYMLISSRIRRIEALRKIGSKLEPGSPLLLSFYTRSGKERRFRYLAAIANVFRTMLVREKVSVGDDLVPYYAHHFFRDQLDEELSEAGFSLVEYGDRSYGHAVARWSGEPTEVTI